MSFYECVFIAENESEDGLFYLFLRVDNNSNFKDYLNLYSKKFGAEYNSFIEKKFTEDEVDVIMKLNSIKSENFYSYSAPKFFKNR